MGLGINNRRPQRPKPNVTGLLQLFWQALQHLGGVEPARAEGGRLVLHFRVGPEGAVQAACAREDDLGDPALRRCVVSRLSALRFPAPDPPGHVDAALPLVFRPDRSAAPRALCP